MTSVYKQRELGRFLRGKRKQLTPADVGVVAGPRRKTPGLRREEVAQLAGLGVSWYTWLEQGRDIRVSAEVLNSVTGALRLSRDEVTYVFDIAGHPAPAFTKDLPDTVSAATQRVLDSMEWTPAYVLNQRWDRIASNRGANALFGEPDPTDPRGSNVIWRLFTSPAIKSLVCNWESVAANTLHEFYTTQSRCTDDIWMEEFGAELMEASAEFRTLWPQREVVPPTDRRTFFNHPVAGRLFLEFSSFYIPDRADHRMCVLVPLPVESTPLKLRDLLQSEE